MTRKHQRFLVSLWTEQRTPGDIAEAIVEAGLIDPEIETIGVAVYGEADFVIQPGSTRLIPIPTANAAPLHWQGFRIGDREPGNIILDSGGLIP